MAKGRSGKKSGSRPVNLWLHPLSLLWFFALALLDLAQAATGYLPLISAAGALAAIVAYLSAAVRRYVYWVVLGIASSVGLGTGLHTFVLFLGPHIARTTLAVYSCHSLDIVPSPLGFECRDDAPPPPGVEPPTILGIYSLVMFDCFFWGLGTALGELPPYFVARGAAVAGYDDEEFEGIQGILARREAGERLHPWERIQAAMYNLMQRFGFWGILLCASIPNPLFDLAGIISGHFGIPLATFFTATFLGKACIKTTMQSLAIVALFSRKMVDQVLAWLARHELMRIRDVVGSLYDQVTRTYHHNAGPGASAAEPDDTESSSSLVVKGVKMAWSLFMVAMIAYFVLSIVVSLARDKQRQMAAPAANDTTTHEGSGKKGKEAAARGRNNAKRRSTRLTSQKAQDI